MLYYFPGEFSPANKYDKKIAEWLSNKTHDVSEVVVVIGKSKDGEMTGEQKYDLWNQYLLNNKQANISIYKDDKNSPLTAIYKLQERLPEDAFGIALPEKIAKNKDFQEVFAMFPNYEVIITPPYEDGVSESMMEALAEDDLRKFIKGLPPELSMDAKKEIFDSLKPEKVEEEGVLSERYWRDMLSGMYNRYGLK